jgi:hypothetical protein
VSMVEKLWFILTQDNDRKCSSIKKRSSLLERVEGHNKESLVSWSNVIKTFCP